LKGTKSWALTFKNVPPQSPKKKPKKFPKGASFMDWASLPWWPPIKRKKATTLKTLPTTKGNSFFTEAK